MRAVILARHVIGSCAQEVRHGRDHQEGFQRVIPPMTKAASARPRISSTTSTQPRSDAVRNQYNRVREKVEDADFGAITDQVRSYVRSNPGKALLISVGVGFVIGLLLRRDSDED